MEQWLSEKVHIGYVGSAAALISITKILFIPLKIRISYREVNFRQIYKNIAMSNSNKKYSKNYSNLSCIWVKSKKKTPFHKN